MNTSIPVSSGGNTGSRAATATGDGVADEAVSRDTGLLGAADA